MSDKTDDYGRIELPDHISSFGDAAQSARALSQFFSDERGGSTDQSLERMAGVLASVCEARNEDIDDSSRYGARVTYVDGDGEAHTAIVLEPEVSAMRTSEAWDPHREEMVDPQEAYPLGTVQLVYPSDGNFSDGYFFDRLSTLEDATSVTPANGPDDRYCYYAGWDYALNE